MAGLKKAARHILQMRFKRRVMEKSHEGVLTLSRHHSMMSEALKAEIAKELGVDDKVRNEGWSAVSSRDCGNIVKKAIEMAERNVVK